MSSVLTPLNVINFLLNIMPFVPCVCDLGDERYDYVLITGTYVDPVTGIPTYFNEMTSYYDVTAINNLTGKPIKNLFDLQEYLKQFNDFDKSFDNKKLDIVSKQILGMVKDMDTTINSIQSGGYLQAYTITGDSYKVSSISDYSLFHRTAMWIESIFNELLINHDPTIYRLDAIRYMDGQVVAQYADCK